jgi:Lon protease-like protein
MRRLQSIPGIQVLAALPVLPLPNVVLLPGMMLPLNVHEPRYLELVDFVRQSGQHIGVPLLRPPTPDELGARLGSVGQVGPIDPLEPVEPVMGIGRLVFHVALPDGRRIIRLEGVGRVRLEYELPRQPRLSRADRHPPLDEPLPADAAQMLALKGQAVEHLARFCRDDGDSLLALLGLRDDRVFLYSLTAFLPSLELLATDIRQWVHDQRDTHEHLLVHLQQRSLAAEDADARARFLLERTRTILDRLGQHDRRAGALLN